MAALRTSLSASGDGPRWRDLSGEEAQRLARHQDGDLAECLRVARDEMFPEVRRTFAQELADPLREEIERAKRHIEQLETVGDAAAKAEAAMLERYCALIEDWEIAIDGIGFFAVNVRC